MTKKSIDRRKARRNTIAEISKYSKKYPPLSLAIEALEKSGFRIDKSDILKDLKPPSWSYTIY